MRIYKNPLDKRGFDPIIRQTDRISLSFSAARSLITPELGAPRKRIASSSGVAVFDIAGNEYDVQIAGILQLSL